MSQASPEHFNCEADAAHSQFVILELLCYDLIKSTYSQGLDGKLHDDRDMACSALFKPSPGISLVP